MTTAFYHYLTIYSDHTDCYGIVYHANYLNYMDHARTEWLEKQLGINLFQLQQNDCQFVVYSANLHFIKPARLADRLAVSCDLTARSRTSLNFQQNITEAHNPQLIYCSGEIKLACVTHTGKVRALPDVILTIK